MNKRTPLYQQHVHAGAKIVDFGGWDMPLHYGSQLDEHHCVRQYAGVFDVSHMTVIDLEGEQSEAFLRYLLANDVARLKQEGKALYSAMLNEEGGILDDLIVYRMAWGFRMVVNCATREKDIDWIARYAKGYKVQVRERDDLAMLAVQGPEAEGLFQRLLSAEDMAKVEELEVFQGVDTARGFVARTGYTGEAGYELVVANDAVEGLWQELLALGVKPIGLGARDTLRLEAGMNLYGADMDEQVNPYQAAMAWTVSWHDESRDFIGRKRLLACKEENDLVLMGLVLRDRAVLRAHQKVVLEEGEGEVTSGSFSPTLNCSIALARIPRTKAAQAQVEIRKKLWHVDIVKPPFVRHGRAVYQKP